MSSKTLNSNGRTDEANALLTEEIKRDPGVDIPKTLSNLVGNPWNDWRDASVSFGTWIQALINHAGKLATSMVTSIVPIIAAYIILKRLLQRQFRPMDEPAHVDIALFNAERARAGNTCSGAISRWPAGDIGVRSVLL